MEESHATNSPIELDCGVQIIPLPSNPITTNAKLAELRAYMAAHQSRVTEMGGELYVERSTCLPLDAKRNLLGTEAEASIPAEEKEHILRSTNWIIDVTAPHHATEFHVHRVGEQGTTEGDLGGTRLLEFYSDHGCTLEFFKVDKDGQPIGAIEHVNVAPGGCLVKFNASNIAHSFQAKQPGICLGVSNHPLDGIGSFGQEGIMRNTGAEGFQVTMPNERKDINVVPPEAPVDVDRLSHSIAQAFDVEAVGFYDPRKLLTSQQNLEKALELMGEDSRDPSSVRDLLTASLSQLKAAEVANRAAHSLEARR